ncbi:6-phosphogluconate dehydrogenase [Flavobacterium algicola]|uniref:6-phosphogluconate dehydrogenase n=1 Tax=Flavobacterium algicola TaxID=556529 RepID=UPI001EFE3D2A|nr:6-phosphogluconate dehydrogenase [Flavobacterium algicola]MCG9791523.1 6-phosphogluconate dehydrogenase [Flavobacterium algicola]
MNGVKKIVILVLLALIIFIGSYFTFIYYVPYSEGVRSGELIKISHKGYVVKTWEGEISQGISGAQIFEFSILDNDPVAIQKLKDFQGQFVKIDYIERYRTFFWWGDTRYFVTNVRQDKSPFGK